MKKPIKEKDIHPKDKDNNYVYPTLKFIAEETLIPSEVYFKVLIEKGVTKSRAKETINALTKNVQLDTIKTDIFYMNKKFKHLSSKTEDEQKLYISIEKPKYRKYDYAGYLGKLNLDKLPLKLSKFRYELSLLL